MYRSLQMDEEEAKTKIEEALAAELGRPVAISHCQWESAVADTLNDIRVSGKTTQSYVWFVLKTTLSIVKRLEANDNIIVA
ncbi:hypothetical protein [Petroclostridium sp. X23]|uniref:hypothetical protein n=1 Tax=Petroclostridium sp. X23 TaxID=3045146 RepID=UPI0024ACC4AA|nr:hypothetical protein [Petroclostridium sp. X23]WHH59198.1 hypothetical protein QKW49_00050 [Petroclostridium sp. X23]